MPGVTTTEVDETSAPHPDAPFGARPAARRPARTVLTIVLGLLLTLVFSWSVIAVLDASSFPSPLHHLRNRLFDSPVLVPSLMAVWVFVLLFVALIGRLWLAFGVLTAITALFGAVNATKLELRNDPLYPSDYTFLSQPSFLFSMVSPSKLVLGAIGLAALVALGWAAGWLVGKVLPNIAKGAGRRELIVIRASRAVIVVICLVLLWMAGNFNEPGNPWRAAFDSTGLRWRDWDQRVNYQRNGFVAGLLFNMHVQAMSEPQGYSKAAVMKIADKYAAEAAAMNKGRTGSLENTNVVTVLSESFSNPEWLKSLKLNSDPIPRTTALMGNTLSGKMLAPGYGSGTANVEFEVLTGMSLSQLKPQISVAYEQVVSKDKTFPSAVDWFLAHGHTPVAIHPFSPRMYARTAVYKAFGFDRFISKDQLQDKSHGGGRFIDDKSAFDEVLHQIQTHQKPVLTHLVTMQNHMPFGGQYDDPMNPQGLPPQFAKLAGQYNRGIARTDVELANFLAALKKQKEPTTVVFWGDHLPPQIYPQSLFKKEGERAMHETPFLIWSSGKPLKHTTLPTTSPIQFLPHLFDAMNAPIPPWYALLDSLDKQIPAMDAGMYVNSQDQLVKKAQLTPEARKALSDYRMIMYDLSIGKRYSEKTMYGDAPAS
ncbi:LTA synthase family protein [Marmoricola sp. URHB0036]|uniref:LTA synthase family protein n=1 Tax=Marmoricola sp. URHB0036 TaxID=1298863 RepID=UPI00041F8CEC|nr:alkaline phosphatase family protein [Marmoricola sp. URHB0036]